jgi:acyl carrier protein
VSALAPLPVQEPPSSSALIKELEDFLQSKLPEYMVPSAFVTLEALPLTAHGKVDRRALPEPGQAQPKLEKDTWVPSNQIEESLARIWAEVLDLERVGGYDTFYTLGGNSLQAAQLIAQIRDTFQIDLPFRSFFEAPTIVALARVIEKSIETDPHAQAQKITPVSRERYRGQLSDTGTVKPLETWKREELE